MKRYEKIDRQTGLQRATLQPPVDPSAACAATHATPQPNISYRFPIFETSATALCSTTGMLQEDIQTVHFNHYTGVFFFPMAITITVLKKHHALRTALVPQPRSVPWSSPRKIAPGETKTKDTEWSAVEKPPVAVPWMPHGNLMMWRYNYMITQS